MNNLTDRIKQLEKDNKYLEKERELLWEEVTSMKAEIAQKPETIERDLKNISKNCAQLKNRIESREKASAEHLGKISANLQAIESANAKQNDLLEEGEGIAEHAHDASAKIQSMLDKANALEIAFGERDEITSKLEELELFATEGEENYKTIADLLTNANSRKKEIEELHNEIIGYTKTDDETGEEIKLKGLKSKLESIYNDLEGNMATAITAFENLDQTTTDKCDVLIAEGNENIATSIESWESKYNALAAKVGGLLPGAMTKGLSKAFSEKREAEIEEGKALGLTFGKAIKGMLGVSLIPLFVSIYMLIDKKPPDEVILALPRLSTTILPLYIPLLWVAYSASKKVNLSKRLVEEYSHKEALSKSYEGLSQQINDIGSSHAAEELRVKLLYNLLAVSSENPGKLITDYNKADHPLLDTLEKSVKLGASIEKLSAIPGIGKLMKVMNKKVELTMDEHQEQSEVGFEARENVTSEKQPE